MTDRWPAVAGAFYEADRERLIEQIEWCFKHPLGPGMLPSRTTIGEHKIIGLVSPHAGYMYSGPIAAHGYYELSKREAVDTVIILGPNHTGMGSGVSIYPEGYWITPLGKVGVDRELGMLIAKFSEIADLDEMAHLHEHSIEVQIPFLQYIWETFSIVPITMFMQTPVIARKLARGIYEAERELGKTIAVIASTDFTHYEPYSAAYRKDKMAIEAILSLDSNLLYERIVQYDISMCGPGPVMTLTEYAKLKNDIKPRLLKYATSGDITGEKATVVGYASIVFY